MTMSIIAENVIVLGFDERWKIGALARRDDVAVDDDLPIAPPCARVDQVRASRASGRTAGR
jgi:hypothetical protein